MAKKETALSAPMTEEQMAILNSGYPIEDSFRRVLLPRLGFYAQDQVEGKGKAMRVVTEAGTFYTDRQSDEETVDEHGKKTKAWEKEEVGSVVEVIIFFERRQLKFFDGEKYTSSPIYDTDDQVIPLFKDKVEIARGLPAELKARPEFQGKSAKGKDISKLEDNKILYVLYKNEVYQMNLRGTSMYNFLTYKRGVQPSSVLTIINSEAKENGAIAWNQMTFTNIRPITSKEADIVIGHQKDIKDSIAQEKAFFATKQIATPKKTEEEDW